MERIQNMNNVGEPDFHKSRHYPFNILQVRREMYMKRITLEEVEARRKDDRILQGVLTEEENLAEWAIKNVKREAVSAVKLK